MCARNERGGARELFLARQIVQTKCNVLRDGAMGKQRVVLKQHADTAFARGNCHSLRRIEKYAVVESDAAAAGFFQAGDAAQQHGFARARCAQNAQRRFRRAERNVQREIRQLLFDLDFQGHVSVVPSARGADAARASSSKARPAARWRCPRPRRTRPWHAGSRWPPRRNKSR